MRLGIIRLSSLGDIARLLPLLAYIHSSYPSIFIIVITEDRFSHIFNYFPFIDDLIIFPRKALGKKTFFKKICCIEEFIHNLRSKQIDIIADLHGIFKSAIISRLSGTRKCTGFSKAHCKEGAFLFYKDYISLPYPPISRINRYFGLLDYLGLKKPEGVSYLRPVLPYEEETFAKNFLKEYGLNEGDYLFFFVGASKKQLHKRWQFQSFIDLASMIVSNNGPPVLIGWGPDEKEIIESNRNQFPSRVIPIPEGNLGHLLYYISRAKCFIGSDTGPLHLSAIMGVTSIALFGPTDPIVNKPYGDRNLVIKGTFDMASITVKGVYERLKDFCFVG